MSFIIDELRSVELHLRGRRGWVHSFRSQLIHGGILFTLREASERLVGRESVALGKRREE
jgi:hypothetical protein